MKRHKPTNPSGDWTLMLLLLMVAIAFLMIFFCTSRRLTTRELRSVPLGVSWVGAEAMILGRGDHTAENRNLPQPPPCDFVGSGSVMHNKLMRKRRRTLCVCVRSLLMWALVSDMINGSHGNDLDFSNAHPVSWYKACTGLCRVFIFFFFFKCLLSLCCSECLSMSTSLPIFKYLCVIQGRIQKQQVRYPHLK